MGAISSSLNIRSMNWSMALREQLHQDVMDRAYELSQSQVNAQTIRDAMTQEEYNAWWETTPDDNHGFYMSTEKKLAELSQSQSSTEAE